MAAGGIMKEAEQPRRRTRPEKAGELGGRFSWSREDTAVVALLVVAVLLSRLPYLVFGRLHFDSDQAVVGLMSKDLVEGRGFPLYFYCQRYLFVILSYLAAPFVFAFGLKIWTVKAPLLALSLFFVLALYRSLRRDVRLGAWWAGAALVPFALPNALMTSRLMQAHGGSVEPLAFMALFWLFRQRPWVLGALAAVAAQNRQYVLAGFAALLAVRLLDREVRLRHIPALVVSFAAVWLAFELVAPYSLNYRGYRAPLRFNAPSRMASLSFYAATELLPVLHGLKAAPLRDLGVQTSLRFSPLVSLVVVSGWLLLGIASLHRRRRLRWRFPVFLLLTAALNVAAFVCFYGRRADVLSVRYFLLTVPGVTALLALLFQTAYRKIAAGFLVLAGVWAVWQHAAVWREYMVDPPPWPQKELARVIRTGGYAGVRTDYWTGYYLGFLLEGSVPVYVKRNHRMPDWNGAYVRAAGKAAVVFDAGPEDLPGAVLHNWRILSLPKEAGRPAKWPEGVEVPERVRRTLYD